MVNGTCTVHARVHLHLFLGFSIGILTDIRIHYLAKYQTSRLPSFQISISAISHEPRVKKRTHAFDFNSYQETWGVLRSRSLITMKNVSYFICTLSHTEIRL